MGIPLHILVLDLVG